MKIFNKMKRMFYKDRIITQVRLETLNTADGIMWVPEKKPPKDVRKIENPIDVVHLLETTIKIPTNDLKALKKKVNERDGERLVERNENDK